MRKIYQNFILIFCFAAILSGCGSGLCPLRTSAGVCPRNGGGVIFVAPSGTIDTTFGNGLGYSYISPATFGLGLFYGGYGAEQSDGKIIVVGAGNPGVSTQFLVTRFNADGSFDTTFGTSSGITLATGGGPGNEIFDGVAIQSDGKIVAAGTGGGGGQHFKTIRFTPDGLIDTAFGVSGVATANFGGSESVNSVYIHTGGSIFVSGMDGNDIAIAKHTTTGALDTSFNGTGQKTIDYAGNQDWGTNIFSLNGGFYIGGTLGPFGLATGHGIAKFSFTTGAVDTTYSSSGFSFVQPVAGNNTENFIASQPDGKILTCGESGSAVFSNYAITRFNADGSQDTGFATGGIYTLDYAGDADSCYKLIVQPDGKILSIGIGTSGGNPQLLILRHLSNGSLDTSFGAAGIFTTNLGGVVTAFSVANMFQKSNGNLVVVGRATIGGISRIIVLRLK